MAISRIRQKRMLKKCLQVKTQFSGKVWEGLLQNIEQCEGRREVLKLGYIDGSGN